MLLTPSLSSIRLCSPSHHRDLLSANPFSSARTRASLTASLPLPAPLSLHGRCQNAALPPCPLFSPLPPTNPESSLTVMPSRKRRQQPRLCHTSSAPLICHHWRRHLRHLSHLQRRQSSLTSVLVVARNPHGLSPLHELFWNEEEEIRNLRLKSQPIWIRRDSTGQPRSISWINMIKLTDLTLGA